MTYYCKGDFVVVTNASKVKVSGKKAQDKKYTRHSGYPGGLKVETFDKVISKKPAYIVEHAVRGMLPHNKLGDTQRIDLLIAALEGKEGKAESIHLI